MRSVRTQKKNGPALFAGRLIRYLMIFQETFMSELNFLSSSDQRRPVSDRRVLALRRDSRRIFSVELCTMRRRQRNISTTKSDGILPSRSFSPQDSPYLAAAYGDLEQLLSIEEILEASRIPMEQREAARKMGSRFAKTIEKLELPVTKEENGIFRRYLTARKGQAINHCCIYGVFCAAMNIPLADALSHYLYAQTSAIVTNCVKTIPLSQSAGQQLLGGCYAEFAEILKIWEHRSAEDLCLSAPGFDIRGIQHETLYSCLYMS